MTQRNLTMKMGMVPVGDIDDKESERYLISETLIEVFEVYHRFQISGFLSLKITQYFHA
jgi:hypothetical protein